MSAVLAPEQLVQEAACCAVLGALAGAVRALAPSKGRAAFLPDVLLVGALLTLLQSYAAGLSSAGVLRWYMAAAGALGALLAHAVLAVPFAAVRRALGWLIALPVRFLRQYVLLPVRLRRHARAERAKERRCEKKNPKKWKKSLQKQSHLLYNSNV